MIFLWGQSPGRGTDAPRGTVPVAYFIDPEGTVPADPEGTVPADPEGTVPADPPADPEGTVPAQQEGLSPKSHLCYNQYIIL